MKLIVGLGNPGDEYQETRHNLGFMVIDKLVEEMKVNIALDKKLKAEVTMFVRHNETLILAKPQTFMNLSGDCVNKIASYYKVTIEDIWIISDDLDLEFSKIRVRNGGGSGGHNGLKDIITKVGSDFIRFRIGIKNPMLEKIAAEKFVLQKFNASEAKVLPHIIAKASELVSDSLEDGIEHSSHQAEIN